MKDNSQEHVRTYRFDVAKVQQYVEALSELKDFMYLILLGVLEFRPPDQRLEEREQLLQIFQRDQTSFPESVLISQTQRMQLTLQWRVLECAKMKVATVLGILPDIQEIMQSPHTGFSPFLHKCLESEFTLTEECYNGMRALCDLITETRLRIRDIAGDLFHNFLVPLAQQTDAEPFGCNKMQIQISERAFTGLYRALPCLSDLLQELYRNLESLQTVKQNAEIALLDQALTYEKSLFPNGHD